MFAQRTPTQAPVSTSATGTHRLFLDQLLPKEHLLATEKQARTVYSLASSFGASAASMALSTAGRSWYSTRTCRAAARARASVSATTMPISCATGELTGSVDTS